MGRCMWWGANFHEERTSLLPQRGLQVSVLGVGENVDLVWDFTHKKIPKSGVKTHSRVCGFWLSDCLCPALAGGTRLAVPDSF